MLIFAAKTSNIMEENRVFKRKIYSKLQEWKQEENGKKALLVKGARRVGKSTIVEEFARNEYKSYMLIDFSKASAEVKSLFDDLMDLDYIFLRLQTIYIVVLGLTAFCFSTIGGLLVGKIMYKVTGGKINPLIGSAGVSAVPMAARVSQIEGQKANPKNFLLMHAMGPNVAGVIGSAIAAGFLLKVFGG